MSFTPGTHCGMAFTRLSTTRPAAASTDPFARRRQMSRQSPAQLSLSRDMDRWPAGPMSSSSATMLVAIREKVATLKKQGRTLDETVAAQPTAPFDAKWGQFLITPAMFTTLVYTGV